MVNPWTSTLVRVSHLLEVEGLVELFFRDEPFFENEVPKRSMLLERAFRNLGGLEVPDEGIEDRHVRE